MGTEFEETVFVIKVTDIRMKLPEELETMSAIKSVETEWIEYTNCETHVFFCSPQSRM